MWHQARVIEDLFFFIAEVGLGAAHPEDVAVENDLAVMQRGGVMLDQPLQREGEEAVHGVVDEAIGPSRFSAQEMRERAVARHVLAPDLSR